MKNEKQIDEMARDICTIPNCNAITCVDLKQKQECDKRCTTYVYAKRFYEKGYRKERQGEWIEHTVKPDWLEDDVEVYYN